MPAPVFNPEDVSAAWLGAVLADAGVAHGTLVGVVPTRIGAGKVGDNVRFTLAWDREGAGPATVVGKFPSPDPMSRAAGVGLGNYEREVRFYRELAGGLPIRIPRCLMAELDDDTGAFVLVMGDLAPAEAGDQLTGCSPDEAAAAAAELAGLHAAHWGDTGLARHAAWLGPRLVGAGESVAGAYKVLLGGFLERYGDRLDATTVAVAEGFATVVDQWAQPTGGPDTLTHNDYRLDNLMFGHDPDTGAATAAVVDWQTVGTGPGVADLSYLLGSGLLPDERRTSERDLLADYGGRLRAAGVAVDDDTLWDGYLRTSPAGLLMAVLASSVVGADDRGDEMFMTMARRHAAQIDDHGVLAVLGTEPRR